MPSSRDGYGVMYPYATRVPPADRLAIVAYIRALQLASTPRSPLARRDRAHLAAHWRPRRRDDRDELPGAICRATRALPRSLGLWASRRALGTWCEPQRFFAAWLVAWLFVLGIALAVPC